MIKTKETKVGGFKTKFFFLNDLVIGVATEVGPRILQTGKNNQSLPGKKDNCTIEPLLPA